MTQELSRLILTNHEANEKAINHWFIGVVDEAIHFYKPSQRKGVAHFLYNDAPGMYIAHRVELPRLDNQIYLNLIRFNYIKGQPILACSVCYPIVQEFEKKTEFCLLITKEYPYMSKRQIWIEIENRATRQTHMIMDQFLSQNADLPEFIEKFAHIIQPSNPSN